MSLMELDSGGRLRRRRKGRKGRKEEEEEDLKRTRWREGKMEVDEW